MALNDILTLPVKVAQDLLAQPARVHADPAAYTDEKDAVQYQQNLPNFFRQAQEKLAEADRVRQAQEAEFAQRQQAQQAQMTADAEDTYRGPGEARARAAVIGQALAAEQQQGATPGTEGAPGEPQSVQMAPPLLNKATGGLFGKIGNVAETALSPIGHAVEAGLEGAGAGLNAVGADTVGTAIGSLPEAAGQFKKTFGEEFQKKTGQPLTLETALDAINTYGAKPLMGAGGKAIDYATDATIDPLLRVALPDKIADPITKVVDMVGYIAPYVALTMLAPEFGVPLDTGFALSSSDDIKNLYSAYRSGMIDGRTFLLGAGMASLDLIGPVAGHLIGRSYRGWKSRRELEQAVAEINEVKAHGAATAATAAEAAPAAETKSTPINEERALGLPESKWETDTYDRIPRIRLKGNPYAEIWQREDGTFDMVDRRWASIKHGQTMGVEDGIRNFPDRAAAEGALEELTAFHRDLSPQERMAKFNEAAQRELGAQQERTSAVSEAEALTAPQAVRQAEEVAANAGPQRTDIEETLANQRNLARPVREATETSRAEQTFGKGVEATKTEGGATISRTGDITPLSGKYLVGDETPGAQIPFDEFSSQSIIDYIRAHPNRFIDDPDAHIGTEIVFEDGNHNPLPESQGGKKFVNIDAVTPMEDKAAAEAFAKTLPNGHVHDFTEQGTGMLMNAKGEEIAPVERAPKPKAGEQPQWQARGKTAKPKPKLSEEYGAVEQDKLRTLGGRPAGLLGGEAAADKPNLGDESIWMTKDGKFVGGKESHPALAERMGYAGAAGEDDAAFEAFRRASAENTRIHLMKTKAGELTEVGMTGSDIGQMKKAARELLSSGADAHTPVVIDTVDKSGLLTSSSSQRAGMKMQQTLGELAGGGVSEQARIRASLRNAPDPERFMRTGESGALRLDRMGSFASDWVKRAGGGVKRVVAYVKNLARTFHNSELGAILAGRKTVDGLSADDVLDFGAARRWLHPEESWSTWAKDMSARVGGTENFWKSRKGDINGHVEKQFGLLGEGGKAADITRLRDLAEQGATLMQKGNVIDMHDWYENFWKTLEDNFGDDAEMMAKFMALTQMDASPAAGVPMAMRAYLQWKMGEPISRMGSESMRNAMEAMVMGKLPRGPKINPFWEALRFGGDRGKNAVAVDRWVIAALGGDMEKLKLLQGNSRFIRFAQRVVADAADEAGVSPRAFQAAIWGGFRKEWDGLLKAAGARPLGGDNDFFENLLLRKMREYDLRSPKDFRLNTSKSQASLFEGNPGVAEVEAWQKMRGDDVTRFLQREGGERANINMMMNDVMMNEWNKKIAAAHLLDTGEVPTHLKTPEVIDDVTRTANEYRDAFQSRIAMADEKTLRKATEMPEWQRRAVDAELDKRARGLEQQMAPTRVLPKAEQRRLKELGWNRLPNDPQKVAKAEASLAELDAIDNVPDLVKWMKKPSNASIVGDYRQFINKKLPAARTYERGNKIVQATDPSPYWKPKSFYENRLVLDIERIKQEIRGRFPERAGDSGMTRNGADTLGLRKGEGAAEALGECGSGIAEAAF